MSWLLPRAPIYSRSPLSILVGAADYNGFAAKPVPRIPAQALRMRPSPLQSNHTPRGQSCTVAALQRLTGTSSRRVDPPGHPINRESEHTLLDIIESFYALLVFASAVYAIVDQTNFVVAEVSRNLHLAS
jgi:hypothetical protein